MRRAQQRRAIACPKPYSNTRRARARTARAAVASEAPPPRPLRDRPEIAPGPLGGTARGELELEHVAAPASRVPRPRSGSARGAGTVAGSAFMDRRSRRLLSSRLARVGDSAFTCSRLSPASERSRRRDRRLHHLRDQLTPPTSSSPFLSSSFRSRKRLPNGPPKYSLATRFELDDEHPDPRVTRRSMRAARWAETAAFARRLERHVLALEQLRQAPRCSLSLFAASPISTTRARASSFRARGRSPLGAANRPGQNDARQRARNAWRKPRSPKGTVGDRASHSPRLQYPESRSRFGRIDSVRIVRQQPLPREPLGLRASQLLQALRSTDQRLFGQLPATALQVLTKFVLGCRGVTLGQEQLPQRNPRNTRLFRVRMFLDQLRIQALRSRKIGRVPCRVARPKQFGSAGFGAATVRSRARSCLAPQLPPKAPR